MSKYQLAQVDLPHTSVRQIVDMLEGYIFACQSKESTVDDENFRHFLRGMKHGCVKGAYAVIKASQELEQVKLAKNH